MSDILKAISDDIAAGAEWTKSKPEPEPKPEKPLPKVSKSVAKRRAAQIKGDRVAVELMLKRARKRMKEVEAAEKTLEKQCPHPKECIESCGFDYIIETCGLCGNSEIY